MNWKVRCPKCGSENVGLFEDFLIEYNVSKAHARCQECQWRSEDVFASNYRNAFDKLEAALTPKKPRTIIDKLRAMTDEEIAGALAARSSLDFCDFCIEKNGKCGGIDDRGAADDERCKEHILAALHTPLTEEKEETTMQEMTLNEYQRLAQRTSNEEHDDFKTLALKKIDNGVLGLCGESGECADVWKKARHQGHKLNVDDLAKECGDVLWYAAELAAGLGLTLEEIARRNIAKLENRYPEGHFEAARSINREE